MGKAAGPMILLALAALVLVACGSGGGETTKPQPPPVSAATAGHLAKLSDRVASELDAGDTCGAAYAADQLQDAVSSADLPATLRPGVEEVATDLVNEVNCPPPPPPPEPEKKPKKPKNEQQGEQQQGEQHRASPRWEPRPQATRPRRQAPSRSGQAQGGARMNQHLGGERYELDHRLGHGGMATVYLARDLKLDREVAIKLLADNYAGDEEVRKRFSREARLAARLDHPNVVQVFDVGEEDDRPYIVMEHVDGGTLADRLNGRKRSMAKGEALRLLGQLCDGLGHAHAKKLVHRDIKPQNLLLRESDGCLKITDFGIARAAEETTRLTRPGKVIGTDRYMAPEQLADGEDHAGGRRLRVRGRRGRAPAGGPGPRAPRDRRALPSRGPGRALRRCPVPRRGSGGGRGRGGCRRRPPDQVAGQTDQAAARRRRHRQLAQPDRGSAPAPLASGTGRGDRRGRCPGGGRTWSLPSTRTAPTRPPRPMGPSSAPRPTVVPRSDDPAQQARELADFLRAQSR